MKYYTVKDLEYYMYIYILSNMLHYKCTFELILQTLKFAVDSNNKYM